MRAIYKALDILVLLDLFKFSHIIMELLLYLNVNLGLAVDVPHHRLYCLSHVVTPITEMGCYVSLHSTSRTNAKVMYAGRAKVETKMLASSFLLSRQRTNS